MRIWIDMSNSPHPLLFAPVARELELRGHEILVTARDSSQTRELTLERWPDAEIIGGPSPPNRGRKALSIFERVRELRRWAKGRGAEVALSHNSYAQLAAARSLDIHAVTAMDYEHQPANHLAFRLANRAVLPEPFPARIAHRQGATKAKLRRFEGIKEEIYLGDFDPSTTVLQDLGCERVPGGTLVVARTPPSGATYHQFENPLFERLLAEVAAQPGCTCIVLARSRNQGRNLRERSSSRLIVPERALDSRSLVYAADLFVGAGGTMTREAALMGVPTISVYVGRRPAVDRALEQAGRLRVLSESEGLGEIRPRAGEPRSLVELRRRAVDVTAGFLTAALA